MTAFDNREFENKRKQYETEAREKWGSTAAYAEYERKAAGYSEGQSQTALEGLNGIFAAFAACRKSGAAPDSPEAQELVQKLQAHITKYFYTCTNPILSGLGQMYVADERFKANIDHNGDGTAEFASRAIAHFCK